MTRITPATAEFLQQLARSSTHDLRIDLQAQGVSIELTDLQLHFVHSFLAGPIAKRAAQPNQLLLKACNNKQRSIERILDITAGWGIDAFVLARHGHEVTLLERNQLVHAVVACSLAQLALAPGNESLAQRLTLELADANHYLHDLNDRHDYDCIYLDPMFAAHKSGAKPAKEMQILQALTANQEIESCFALALAKARKRVVVKRAAKAAPLAGAKPDLVQRAKTIRFDIYLTG
jgi:16S rRNA (guanine1516-N2)-methyltransferase